MGVEDGVADPYAEEETLINLFTELTGDRFLTMRGITSIPRAMAEVDTFHTYHDAANEEFSIRARQVRLHHTSHAAHHLSKRVLCGRRALLPVRNSLEPALKYLRKSGSKSLKEGMILTYKQLTPEL